MRHTERLQNQLTSVPIGQIEPVPNTAAGGSEVLQGLQSLFADAQTREQLFDLLEQQKVYAGHRLGRLGMNLRSIAALADFKLRSAGCHQLTDGAGRE